MIKLSLHHLSLEEGQKNCYRFHKSRQRTTKPGNNDSDFAGIASETGVEPKLGLGEESERQKE